MSDFSLFGRVQTSVGGDDVLGGVVTLQGPARKLVIDELDFDATVAGEILVEVSIDNGVTFTPVYAKRLPAAGSLGRSGERSPLRTFRINVDTGGQVRLRALTAVGADLSGSLSGEIT